MFYEYVCKFYVYFCFMFISILMFVPGPRCCRRDWACNGPASGFSFVPLLNMCNFNFYFYSYFDMDLGAAEEIRHVTVWPVDLQQVDVVCP